MTQPDGGAAFPFERKETRNTATGPNQVVAVQYPGMSLRDYFAAAALTGLLATSDQVEFKHFHAASYAHADAMLAEREKGK